MSKQKKQAAKLVEAKSKTLVKLDLGCGQNPQEGFEGVDVRGGKAKHAVDLFKFPWPFANESVEEIYCSHFCEHIPAREIEDRDISIGSEHKDAERFIGQDMLFAFMDECYRILIPEGWMTVIVPSARNNRGFQDPTHRRFFVQETFIYFAREFRRVNALDHYIVNCNFGVNVGASYPNDELNRSDDAKAMRHNHYWNVTYDFIAKMQKQA